MDDRQKLILSLVLGAMLAGASAPLAADQSIKHIWIVLPLVLMGFCLFAAGYYSAQYRNRK